jgi:hypothetical protein
VTGGSGPSWRSWVREDLGLPAPGLHSLREVRGGKKEHSGAKGADWRERRTGFLLVLARQCAQRCMPDARSTQRREALSASPRDPCWSACSPVRCRWEQGTHTDSGRALPRRVRCARVPAARSAVFGMRGRVSEGRPCSWSPSSCSSCWGRGRRWSSPTSTFRSKDPAQNRKTSSNCLHASARRSRESSSAVVCALSRARAFRSSFRI